MPPLEYSRTRLEKLCGIWVSGACEKHDCSHFAFQYLQTIQPVDQIQQAIVGAKNIVALDRLLTAAGFGHVVTDLCRKMRIADVDDAKAAAEPGDKHLVVVDLLGGLVRAVLMARFDTVTFRSVKGRDRHWSGLIRDIDHPHESVRRRRELAGLLVGNDHH